MARPRKPKEINKSQLHSVCNFNSMLLDIKMMSPEDRCGRRSMKSLMAVDADDSDRRISGLSLSGTGNSWFTFQNVHSASILPPPRLPTSRTWD